MTVTIILYGWETFLSQKLRVFQGNVTVEDIFLREA